LNNASLDISVVGRAALVENASSFVFSWNYSHELKSIKCFLFSASENNCSIARLPRRSTFTDIFVCLFWKIHFQNLYLN
jgi:hypothetical protein